MNEKYKILLVDDDTDILEFLSYNLRKESYNVSICTSGLDAIDKVKTTIPHLILLDVMMPGLDGIETCEELRKNPALDNTIIAFLTARGEDYSQIAGFEAGADEYIIKPIKPKLLSSRISALLKRLPQKENASDNNIINIGNLTIDKTTYVITINNNEISLPKKEFELLFFLAMQQGKIVSREQIYQRIWGADVIVGDRTIDVYIRKLRGVIGDQRIQTVKGVGYKFIG